MDEKHIKEKLKTGWLHVLVTFEIMGKPKEHVNSTLDAFLKELKKDERIAVIEEHIGKAEKRDDTFFSAFAEMDILLKNFDTLTWICVNYTPASVEIVEPDKFQITALDLQNHFNDLLARLHTIGMTYKSQTGHVAYLKENFTKLIHNLIIMSLAKGPKKIEQISKETTLVEKMVEERLKVLLKEGQVVEKKGVYSLK